MQFLYNNVLVYNVNIKTLKNAPTCSDLYSDHPQGACSSSLKSLSLKLLKIIRNVKGPLWQCGSIHLMCLHGVLCADVSWTAVHQFIHWIFVLSLSALSFLRPHNLQAFCLTSSGVPLQSNLHLHTERHADTPNVCCHIAIMDLLHF